MMNGKKGLLSGIVTLILFVGVIWVAYLLWQDMLEEREFENEYGMSRGEYKCKTFCEPNKYYYVEKVATSWSDCLCGEENVD